MRLIFRHEEAGLTVTLESDGPYGALSEAGLGSAAGLPAGLTTPDGLTTLGGQPYTLPTAPPDAPEPPLHRLTVWRSGRAVRVVTFKPRGTGAELDVLAAAVDDVWY